MKKIYISLLLIITCLLAGCAKQENYTYNRDGILLNADREILIEQYQENIRTVYYFNNEKYENQKSYLYVMREDDHEEYSLEDAANYLTSIKDILKSEYQLSKKEDLRKRKTGNNKMYVTTSCSAKDSEDKIYELKIKYINDNGNALMAIAFINDKEPQEVKRAYNLLFDSIELKENISTDEEISESIPMIGAEIEYIDEKESTD